MMNKGHSMWFVRIIGLSVVVASIMLAAMCEFSKLILKEAA